MNRSLYSMILSDDVVSAVDKIAMRMNTNRSSLVNQILAEYVQMMTPEKRIENIFTYIADLLSSDTELVPFVSPHQMTMSMKSSLEYKYRPTIKYSVELFRSPDGAIGELTVSFRTQSQMLLDTITEFFTLMKRLEDAYISQYYPHGAITYALYDGKFVRSLCIPSNRNYNNEELGNQITSYVRMFDTLIKGYISGKLSPSMLEEKYTKYLNNGVGLI